MLLSEEQELLWKIASGSEPAFRELFQAYRRKLFSYVFKITESREVAEDAIQDIFLKLWAVRETLPAIGNMNAYLHRMAHNYAYQGFRQLAKETLLLDHLRKQEPDAAYSPVRKCCRKRYSLIYNALLTGLRLSNGRFFYSAGRKV